MNIRTKLIYGEKKFEAVICLDADLPSMHYLNMLKGLPLFAADGAAIKLYQKGFIPDYVIGDLDTFSKSKYSDKFDKKSIFQVWDQELNDFEKTMNFAFGKKFKDVLVIGFHGGELEHTLNNWSVFKRVSTKMNPVILDKKRYGFTLSKSTKILTKKNEMISLIPQPAAVLTTKNLRWNLTNEELRLGSREGTRNIALENEISIEIHSGELLIFMDERMPVCPEII